MAWERRQRGGEYYTRSHRADGEVIREYLGCGPFAKAMAALDTADQEWVLRQRETDRAVQENLSDVDRKVNAFDFQVDAVLWQMIEAAGYHRHRRGQWRKRRRSKKVTSKQLTEAETSLETSLDLETSLEAIHPPAVSGSGEMSEVPQGTARNTESRKAEERKARQAVVKEGLFSKDKEKQEQALACLREHPGENGRDGTSFPKRAAAAGERQASCS